MGNRGVVTKLDPAQLAEIQYQKLLNMVSAQEGALRSRNGNQKITTSPLVGPSGPPGILSNVHTICRLDTGSSDPAENYLYIGGADSIYRYTAEVPPVLVPSAGGWSFAYPIGLDFVGKKWTAQPFRKSSSGTPYMYFATPSTMRKDVMKETPSGDFELLGRWGSDPPVWPAQAAVTGVGNLASPIAKYNYVYTFRNPSTGHESNPSVPMLESLTVDASTGSQITVTVRAHCPSEYPDHAADTDTVNPEVAGWYRTIGIYRKGGSFSDGLYRRVAYIDGYFDANVDISFVDDIPDSVIASNPTVDFDNDRPVTTNLPTPLMATVSAVNLIQAGSTITGKVELTLDVLQGFASGETDLRTVLHPGTAITIGMGLANEERCVVASMGWIPPYKIIVCVQQAHSTDESVYTSAISNQPCPYSAVAFNSIFLAGDAYNPNLLYKSKTGRPEAFPVVNLTDGSPGNIEVGAAGDPIMNICEFSGSLVCLNKAHLYLINVWNGVMQTPQVMPAQRGLFARWGFCKADNEIWYMGYDGIYSWAGGQSTKRSEAIDPIFKGEFFNGFYPISFSTVEDANGISDLERIKFTYRHNEVFILYRDTSGVDRRLRYHTLYDRWSTEDITSDCAMVEEITGRALFSKATAGVAALYLDDSPTTAAEVHTTDGWVTTQDDGADIAWECRSGWHAMGAPSIQKQFGDIILELQNPANAVTVEVFYDFSDTVAETFTIAAAAGRRRFVLPINSGAAREAFAISFRFYGAGDQPTTLYSLTYNYLSLEQVQRGRATDWDNLGYPHDKRLEQLSLEYDVRGTDVILNLDIMNGIGGATQTLAVQSFTLSSPALSVPAGPTRARTTFPINDGIVAKLIRLRPTQTGHDVKLWDYYFDFLKYPPDKVFFTEWENLGYPCEKVLRDLILEIDTGGVEATVAIQIDGLTKRSFKIKTIMDDRHLIISLNKQGDPELIGKQFRLLFTPGPGGKVQLFNHQFNAVREPCANIFWSSLEQNFGTNAFKFIKQMWLMYRSCAGVMLRVYTDDQQLLFEKELPAHEHRDVERCYPKAISTAGVLNKSRVYTFTVESREPCCPVYVYADGTFVEWNLFGADMRQGYQRAPLAQPMERTAMP